MFMRRIQSERPKNNRSSNKVLERKTASRTSQSEDSSDNAWDQIFYTSTAGSRNKSSHDLEKFSVQSSDEDIGKPYGFESIHTFHSESAKDNYAPKRVSMEFQPEEGSKRGSLEIPQELAMVQVPLRHRGSLERGSFGHGTSTTGSFESFNEELASELASLRERLSAKHVHSVHELLTERNRLRAELANSIPNRRHQRSSTTGSDKAALRPAKLNSPPQDAQDGEGTPKSARTPVSGSRRSSSEKPQSRPSSPVRGEGRTSTGNSRLRPDGFNSNASGAHELQVDNADPNDHAVQGFCIRVAQTEELDTKPKAPSNMPPECAPEPPANLPYALIGCDDNSDKNSSNSAVEVGMAMHLDDERKSLSTNDHEVFTGGDETFDSHPESSDCDSVHSDEEEKFELWGIWQKNSTRHNTARRTSVNQCIQRDSSQTGSEEYQDFKNTLTGSFKDASSFLPLQAGGSMRGVHISDEAGRSARSIWCSKRLMLLPASSKHIIWELLGLAFIVYDAILIPLHTFDLSRSSMRTVIQLVICVFRTLDLVKKFFTGYIRNEGTIEFDPVKVAVRYLRTWLFLDAICTLCDWMYLGMSNGGSVRSILELIRMLRMLRVFGLAPEIESLLTERMSGLDNGDIMNLISSVVKSIIALLTVSHLIACGVYAFHKIALETSETSWVRERQLENAPLWERYVWSLHWSLGQFVGEYIFMPTCVAERSFALFVLLFALLFSALFVSTITTAMTRLQILAGKQASQMAMLRRYLFDNNISPSLSIRVLRNAEHHFNSSKHNIPEKRIEILNVISEPLRVELHYEVHFPILAVHPWFARYQYVNPAGLSKVCHSGMRTQPFQRGDVVFSEFETPVWPRMFFVVSGSFSYDHQVVSDTYNVKSGEWACEAVLWTRWMHCGTLTAGADSVLASLDAEKFTNIVSPFPTAHAVIYGQCFVHDLNSTGRSHITDLVSERCEQWVDLAFRAVQERATRSGGGTGSVTSSFRGSITAIGSRARSSATNQIKKRFSSLRSELTMDTKVKTVSWSSRRMSNASRQSEDAPVRKLKSINASS